MDMEIIIELALWLLLLFCVSFSLYWLHRIGRKPKASMSLFNWSEMPLKLHSGGYSHFKIDCDVLTKDDWEAIAAYLADAEFLPPFGKVVGIPDGGLPFAEALKPYKSEGSKGVLVVDDVLTTGNSIVAEMRYWWIVGYPCSGLVLFARRKPPPGIRAVFSLIQPSWGRGTKKGGEDES